MLKAHQACIDLEKNVLRIRGREVKFLAEHELPEKARIMNSGEEEPSHGGPSSSVSPSNPHPRFPGSGNPLGGNPEVSIRGNDLPRSQRTLQSQHSEEKIGTLMNLGATREIAISKLDAAGGNLDVAASLLF